jgi:phenylalanyl-tRNA synthetase beta chain
MVLLRERVRDALVAAGLQEVITYPLVSLEELQKAHQLDPESPPMRIANPLNASQPYLRTSLRASLLATLATNQGHHEGPFRFFECARVFLPHSGQLPDEPEMAAGLLAGRRWESSWLVDNSSLDFYDAKGAVATVLDGLGVSAVYWPTEDLFFHPGRCARVMSGESQLGIIGELHPTVRTSFDLKPEKVAFFELDLAKLLQVIPQTEQRFRPMSRFPAAIRDLALVVSADVPSVRVQDILTRHPLVEHVELFDVYTGNNIPPGTRSLAFHVYLQSYERTLTAEEVNHTLQRLLSTLEQEIGASLRAY